MAAENKANPFLETHEAFWRVVHAREAKRRAEAEAILEPYMKRLRLRPADIHRLLLTTAFSTILPPEHKDRHIDYVLGRAVSDRMLKRVVLLGMPKNAFEPPLFVDLSKTAEVPINGEFFSPRLAPPKRTRKKNEA